MDNWLATKISSTELLNKTSQKDVINEINNLICEGTADPLLVDVTLKALENIINGVRKNAQVRDLVLKEADKYEGKIFDRFGAKMTLSQKTTWDYKNDANWQDLKDKIKKREQFLKALEKDMVDPETGELATKPDYKITEFLKIEFE